MKKFITIIIVAGIVALMGLLLINNKKKLAEQTSRVSSAEATEQVATVTIKETAVNHSFTSNAMVQAVKELNFVSEITGRVIEVYADKGTKVNKGTPLLRIDSELIEADYTAALAAYNSLKKDEERFTRSNAVGGVTDQQLDAIRTQVQAAQSRLAMSTWKKENAVVKAPISGTVNMRYIETGSLIAPNAPLFEIVDDSKLKVICMVPENKIGLIRKGQVITATDNNIPDKTFTGSVKSIGVKTDRGLNYPVEVILDKDKALHIGMYLNVRFTEEGEAKGILVPRKAIVGSAMAANVYLAVDGKAVRREVSLGDMFGNEIEVTSGLKEGDNVIVSGLMNIADGSAITIRQ